MIEITDDFAVNFTTTWDEEENTLLEWIEIEVNQGDIGVSLDRDEAYRLYSLLKAKFHFEEGLIK
jgi:hypothetical protein